MTKFQLFALLASNDYRTVTINGITGLLSSIEREDGSGRSFIVTLNTSKGKRSTYLRTID